MALVWTSSTASCGRPVGLKKEVTSSRLPSAVHPSSFTAWLPCDRGLHSFTFRLNVSTF
jgi:hypothetical protein